MPEPNYNGLTDKEIVAAWWEWEGKKDTPFDEAYDCSHLVTVDVKPGFEEKVKEVLDEVDYQIDEDDGAMLIDVDYPTFVYSIKDDETLYNYWIEGTKLKREWLGDYSVNG